MTEDTDWLKKNPRMSLWRSSRFYGQDMDASVMANDQKSKNDILAVSHVPRRSNIPIEKIKQMDFKFPAPPISKKSRNTKSVCRVSKFAVPQVSITRPSNAKPVLENKNGLQRQSFAELSGKASLVSRPSTNFSNTSSRKSRHVQRTPMLAEKLNEPNVKSSADLSLLSRSKVVHQSTPNESTIVRSILKQNRGGAKNCARNLLDDKKYVAAKRVNFNGTLKEKENKENEEKTFPQVATEEFNINETSRQPNKNNLVLESDEESIVDFTKSFKPLPLHDAENGDENEGDAKENMKAHQFGGGEEKSKNKVNCKNLKFSDSGKFVNGLLDVWKDYQNRFNIIKNQLQLIDDTFQRTLLLVINNKIWEKLSHYEKEKAKLYENLKDLELEFREKVKSCKEVRPIFQSYVERKKSIFKIQTAAEENFEEALRAVLQKCAEESCFGIEKEENLKEIEKISLEIPLLRDEVVKEVSTVKRNSGQVKAGAVLRKRNSKEAVASNDISPDNTPARRKKLSRKIEMQIRNLYEE